MRACCADLRVLNKGDFKMLLKWRLELLKAEKEYVAQLQREQAAAEGKEIPAEEAKKKEEAKEEAKDVSQELQEVRERVAVRERGAREA